MKNLMLATAAILSLSACDVLNPDEPAKEIDYIRATAILRACPPAARIVRNALSDSKLTTGESHDISRAYSTAYGRRARAEMRAEAMKEAGLKRNFAMPAECSDRDPKNGDVFLLRDLAIWGFEHSD